MNLVSIQQDKDQLQTSTSGLPTEPIMKCVYKLFVKDKQFLTMVPE